MENTAQNPKWYDKVVLVALLCIVFFPVGLYGLWKNNEISSKWKLGVTILISLIVIGQLTKNKTKTINVSSTTEESRDSIAKEVKENNCIPDASPIDVYLNLENKGFITKKSEPDPISGRTWTSKKSYTGIDITVTTFSHDYNTVESVTASAIITDVLNKNIIASKQILMLIASLPYTNNDPKKASQWVDNNFNRNNATINISGVCFTIYAPSALVRTLYIGKCISK